MKRKGFTLVELLIVIVVIGILSAMMMLSSTEAVTSARANNVVSNLRNLKTAALALYVDKLDDWETTTTAKKPTKDQVKAYMGTSGSDNYDDYVLAFKGSNAPTSNWEWYIVYNCDGTDSNTTRVKEKLAGRATSTGLKYVTSKVTEGSTITTSDFNSSTSTGSVKAVCMQIR